MRASSFSRSVLYGVKKSSARLTSSLKQHNPQFPTIFHMGSASWKNRSLPPPVLPSLFLQQYRTSCGFIIQAYFDVLRSGLPSLPPRFLFRSSPGGLRRGRTMRFLPSLTTHSTFASQYPPRILRARCYGVRVGGRQAPPPHRLYPFLPGSRSARGWSL